MRASKLSAFLISLCIPPLAGAACVEPVRDWARLCAYADANDALTPSATPRSRVVFMGDSITEFWDRDRRGAFASESHINRGISGQTTSQMLLRFRQDVISLNPRAVVLLAGTNDIAGNTGPTTVEAIFGNIASMCELATQHGIRVVILSVLPAAKYYWAPEVDPKMPIIELNERLRAYANASKHAYVDLFAVMRDAELGMDARFTDDGIHPNATGYATIWRELQPVLSTVLTANMPRQ